MEVHEGDGLVMNRVLTARGTVQEATAPTPTTGNGCGTGVVIRDNDSIPDLQDGEVAAMLTPGRIQKRQNGPRCKTDGTMFTITTQDKHGIAESHGSSASATLRTRVLASHGIPIVHTRPPGTCRRQRRSIQAGRELIVVTCLGSSSKPSTFDHSCI